MFCSRFCHRLESALLSESGRKTHEEEHCSIVGIIMLKVRNVFSDLSCTHVMNSQQMHYYSRDELSDRRTEKFS